MTTPIPTPTHPTPTPCFHCQTTIPAPILILNPTPQTPNLLEVYWCHDCGSIQLVQPNPTTPHHTVLTQRIPTITQKATTQS